MGGLTSFLRRPKMMSETLNRGDAAVRKSSSEGCGGLISDQFTSKLRKVADESCSQVCSVSLFLVASRTLAVS